MGAVVGGDSRVCPVRYSSEGGGALLEQRPMRDHQAADNTQANIDRRIVMV